MFKDNVAENPGMPFLGTRELISEYSKTGMKQPTFGQYRWKTMEEADKLCINFAKGIIANNLCPMIEGENGTPMNFLGIWSKNRWEWTVSLIAAMHYGITIVGFYDAMGVEQVEFILKQTEMTSIVCAGQYAEKIIDMAGNGMAQHIRNIVLMEGESVSDEAQQKAGSLNISLHQYMAVCATGEQNSSAPDFNKPSEDKVYILSYTSGTTGDPKGVKITHANILSNARCCLPRMQTLAGDTVISYLPYTHSFE